VLFTMSKRGCGKSAKTLIAFCTTSSLQLTQPRVSISFVVKDSRHLSWHPSDVFTNLA